MRPPLSVAWTLGGVLVVVGAVLGALTLALLLAPRCGVDFLRASIERPMLARAAALLVGAAGLGCFGATFLLQRARARVGAREPFISAVLGALAVWGLFVALEPSTLPYGSMVVPPALVLAYLGGVSARRLG